VSDEWRNFGPVAGIFWIRGLGIAFRPYGSLDSYHGPTYDAHRFWPFVILWVPKHER
jgi:hypothetical protein